MKVIRPSITRYSIIGTSVVNLSAVVSVFATNTINYLPSLISALGFFDVAIWLLFVEPRIRFDENTLIITNPLRVLVADWAAVRGFETKFGLTAVWADGKFVSWSAPSPSRLTASRIRKVDLRGTSLQGEPYIEPGQLASSESGSALIQLEQARQLSQNQNAIAKVTLNWIGVGGLLAALALGFVALHF
jgi:hypothetical protein